MAEEGHSGDRAEPLCTPGECAGPWWLFKACVLCALQYLAEQNIHTEMTEQIHQRPQAQSSETPGLSAPEQSFLFQALRRHQPGEFSTVSACSCCSEEQGSDLERSPVCALQTGTAACTLLSSSRTKAEKGTLSPNLVGWLQCQTCDLHTRLILTSQIFSC